MIDDAVREGIDMFITGEFSHTAYHSSLEGKLNVVAGGHYSTEVWGVRNIMQLVSEKFGKESGNKQGIEQGIIEVEFIDNPTGL